MSDLEVSEISKMISTMVILVEVRRVRKLQSMAEYMEAYFGDLKFIEYKY